MPSARPDFFIVGAPKCGTTSLDHYLAQHPEVFIPESKQLHYFGRDLEIHGDWFTLDKYLDYFKDAPPGAIVGEGSGLYLYSKTAASEIHHFNPNAKIIMMLRNPTEAAHALHGEMLWAAIENIESFEQAVAAGPDRERGPRLANTTLPKDVLNYRKVYQYASQVQRYLDLFGRERVHPVIFDDLKTSTLEEYSKVCSFLGVDGTFVPDVAVHNRSKRLRNRKLAKLLRRPPGAVRMIYRLLIPTSIRSRWRRGLTERNTAHAEREPMSPSFRVKLRREYSADVVALSQLVGIDLTFWNENETT